jgi:hypothetical protein
MSLPQAWAICRILDAIMVQITILDKTLSLKPFDKASHICFIVELSF